MNKSWTSHKQIMKKSWASFKQLATDKLAFAYAQLYLVMNNLHICTSHETFKYKSGKYREQVMNEP